MPHHSLHPPKPEMLQRSPIEQAVVDPMGMALILKR